MTVINTPVKRKKKMRPGSLIREEWGEYRFYYQGYQSVQGNHHSPEAIMGSSVVQSLLVSLLMFYLRAPLFNWDDEVLLIDGVTLHIERLLQAEGIL